MLTKLKMNWNQGDYRVSEQIERQVRYRIAEHVDVQATYRTWSQVMHQVWTEVCGPIYRQR